MKKISKKILRIIIIVILAIAILSVGTFFGVKFVKNNIGKTIVSLEEKTALQGDSVKMPVTISKNHGLWCGRLVITFDSSALEFVSCANGVVFDECEVNGLTDSVVVLLNQSDLKDVKDNGIIATINFNVKQNATKGKYEIKFYDDTEFCNIDAEIKEVDLIDGSIIVK